MQKDTVILRSYRGYDRNFRSGLLYARVCSLARAARFFAARSAKKCYWGNSTKGAEFRDRISLPVILRSHRGYYRNLRSGLSRSRVCTVWRAQQRVSFCRALREKMLLWGE